MEGDGMTNRQRIRLVSEMLRAELPESGKIDAEGLALVVEKIVDAAAREAVGRIQMSGEFYEKPRPSPCRCGHPASFHWSRSGGDSTAAPCGAGCYCKNYCAKLGLDRS